jgi:hypothetical protein
VYSISSVGTQEAPGTAAFVVDSATGVISTNIASTAWNFNTKSVFVFTATVTEPSTSAAPNLVSASITITVTLTHVNRPPVFTSNPTVQVPAGSTGIVLVLSSFLNDPDLTVIPSVDEVYYLHSSFYD